MKRELKQLVQAARDWKYTTTVLSSDKYSEERIKAEIIRLVHSVEKGLCIDNPGLGFGAQKIENLFTLCKEYLNLNPSIKYCLYMACDALMEYVIFHKNVGYSSEVFDKICTELEKMKLAVGEHSGVCGGTEHVIRTAASINPEVVEKLFSTRHSIRDFSGEHISDEEISAAVRLTQRVPSACNRQAVRVYSVASDTLRAKYSNGLEGIGGFAEDTDRFLLITGKMSAYRIEEKNQYIVSASMFASYLTLALLSYGIGSCIIQRPLGHSNQWNTIRSELGIPGDEQLVVMIALGKLKDQYHVPVSGRFPVDEVLKRIV
jgi:nitroreductase